jgi:hypothetical protein
VREHDHTKSLKIIVSIDETIAGTALDKLPRREQTKAVLDLLRAHRSRVHIASRSSRKEKPCD